MSLKVTVALKAFGAQKGWWKDDASDDSVRNTVAAKMVGGEIAVDELGKLTKEAAAPGTGTMQQILDVQKAQGDLLKSLSEEIVKGRQNGLTPIAGRIEHGLTQQTTLPPTGATTSAEKALGLGSAAHVGNLEYIPAEKKFDVSKRTMTYHAKFENGVAHPWAGKPVVFEGRTLSTPSDLDKAVAQAWFKYNLARKGQLPSCFRLTQTDLELVQYALRSSDWVGGYGGSPEQDGGCTNRVDRRRLNESEVAMFDPANWTKASALIDDATSGGHELVPVEFDDAVIMTPLLFGQLFPFIEVFDVARGNVMQGGVIGNPTFGYTAEGTAITPFTTDAFVTAFGTTIYPATCAFPLGRDFQQDSPARIGDLVITAIGNAAKKWLDDVVATGNGTNQPQGIFTFSTPINVIAENPTTGPITVSDYDALLAAMPVENQQAEGGRLMWVGTQTTYSRSRGVPVGTDDQRRVFGMAWSSYQIMELPFKINSTVSNNQLALFNGGGYRMYRRLGMTTTVVREGVRANLENMDYIIVRMRFGGKMKLANYLATITNLQA